MYKRIAQSKAVRHATARHVVHAWVSAYKIRTRSCDEHYSPEAGCGASSVSLHSGSGAEPLKGTLSGESCILKISEQTHYLSPRMETPFSILMWTGIVVISWYCHIHGLCFYPECLSCPAWPHARPRYRSGHLQRQESWNHRRTEAPWDTVSTGKARVFPTDA